LQYGDKNDLEAQNFKFYSPKFKNMQVQPYQNYYRQLWKINSNCH
jgi:hypothetical protein